ARHLQSSVFRYGDSSLLLHQSCYSFLSTLRPPPSPTLFPYTTLFRSIRPRWLACASQCRASPTAGSRSSPAHPPAPPRVSGLPRSEEHTSELQSRFDLVCRLLLEKKKKN